MATHTLLPEAKNLRGNFDRTAAPILTIRSGDQILAQTPEADGANPIQADPYGEYKLIENLPDLNKGHCLLGPIYIDGAEPGDLVEISLDKIEPGSYGWCCAGGWESQYNVRLGIDTAEHAKWKWKIDPVGRVAVSQHGRTLPVAPFLGLIGLTPAAPGPHSTHPPRAVGGNLDCRELVEGTILYLPVEVPGGLLQFGDGHAVQGDGEVAGPAMECPMSRVEMTVLVHKGRGPARPRAIAPCGWISFGFHENLEDAMYSALNDMADWIEEAEGVTRPEAVMICSLEVSLRVTQIVNGVKGVHAIWAGGLKR